MSEWISVEEAAKKYNLKYLLLVDYQCYTL